jgi:hypothetical protein
MCVIYRLRVDRLDPKLVGTWVVRFQFLEDLHPHIRRREEGEEREGKEKYGEGCKKARWKGDQRKRPGYVFQCIGENHGEKCDKLLDAGHKRCKWKMCREGKKEKGKRRWKGKRDGREEKLRKIGGCRMDGRKGKDRRRMNRGKCEDGRCRREEEEHKEWEKNLLGKENKPRNKQNSLGKTGSRDGKKDGIRGDAKEDRKDDRSLLFRYRLEGGDDA